ncbi:MAG TPA: hypothetical protein VKF84_14835 [Candidatus Sulfotelmatobacter sp.]|nr:hypothetical protein [Candidatus Sulfotelmatobacter sp.]
MQTAKQSCVEHTTGFLPGAEKELAAYAGAVQELFGSEQARQSVEDWLTELELMDWPARDALPDWRHVTVAAATRLARRVNALRPMDRAEFLEFAYRAV